MGELEGKLKKVQDLLKRFEDDLDKSDIREQVIQLIPIIDTFRNLGKAVIPEGLHISARDRILRYFLLYPQQIINERELAVVGGISEWARRVRELRVQFGWQIFSGLTAQSMIQEEDIDTQNSLLNMMGTNDYILLDEKQDKKAAYRWNVANEIRKSNTSMRDKIIAYLRKNVAEEVTGEELRYVAKGSEWARRVRELRVEQGWPITTLYSGNPTLPVGVYVLEADRQAPMHDRQIPEAIRRKVLRRDNYTCNKCGWSYKLWNPSDPRFLEVHHILGYAKGGKSEEDNLITYCNVCHDLVHKLDKKS
ncbi:MAG: HNH endonuclease signature motif containing protein [Spirochaetia bacterium]